LVFSSAEKESVDFKGEISVALPTVEVALDIWMVSESNASYFQFNQVQW
jgi:hypothetical protein